MAAYYNEIDASAAQWLRNLISAGLIAPGYVDERSIVDVKSSDLSGYEQCHFFAGIGGWPYALKLAGWPDEQACWTGSCPCQPLSVAGHRKGHADERHLWPAFHRLISECSPSIIFGEQVASADGREWFAGVRADLEASGYAVGAANLCAAGVGTPHIRQRLWWCASNGDGARLQTRHERNRVEASADTIESWSKLKRVHATGAWSAWQTESALPVFMDGVPARVAATRAYGNAVVPQVAAEFITACSETLSG